MKTAKATTTVLETILERAPDARTMTFGLVLSVSAKGGATVICAGKEVTCELLHSSTEPLHLARGDKVLLWLPGGNEHGVILGRIGPSQAAEPMPDAATEETPEQLVLEAAKNLTLKCGAGSITIRADGKILIKGKDLVSHAQGTNRIKGGSVAIN